MTTASDHDHIEELVAAAALYGLDDEGRRQLEGELARHGACEICARLRSEYDEVAAQLGLSVEPLPLSPGAEDRLLEAARTIPRLTVSREGEPAPRAIPGRAVRRRPHRPGVARRWVAAASVAAVLAVGAGSAGYLLAPREAPASVLAFVSDSATRIVRFPGSDGQRLAVAYRPDGRALVFGANLEPPPEGKVYELWYRPPGRNEMEPAGTFVPRDGVVAVETTVGRRFDALAVSIEPEGGSPRPTSAPVFLTTV